VIVAHPFEPRPLGPNWLEHWKHLSLGSGIACAGAAIALGYVVATLMVILSGLIKFLVVMAALPAAYLVVDFFRSGDEDEDYDPLR
jgi:hypothetical protein